MEESPEEGILQTMKYLLTRVSNYLSEQHNRTCPGPQVDLDNKLEYLRTVKLRYHNTVFAKTANLQTVRLAFEPIQ